MEAKYPPIDFQLTKRALFLHGEGLLFKKISVETAEFSMLEEKEK